MSDFTEELLRDIDETTVEVFELGDRRQAKRTAKSQRKAYVKGIEEVRDTSGQLYRPTSADLGAATLPL